MDPFAHRVGYLGAGRVEGVVDVKPDDHTGICQERQLRAGLDISGAELCTPSKVPLTDMIIK